ncbi:hypothetical protein D3C73_1338980 [compost metagenome]
MPPHAPRLKKERQMPAAISVPSVEAYPNHTALRAVKTRYTTSTNFRPNFSMK